MSLLAGEMHPLIRYVAGLPENFFDLLFGYDFFISYAHDDGSAYPEKLDQDLRALGFDTHLDVRDYHVGNHLGRLTSIRLRNSRNLVVICRPEALRTSKWVRRELDAFDGRNRALRLIDVEDAVEAALVDPPAETAAEWLSQPIDPGSEASRAVMILRIKDRTGAPDTKQRLPGAAVAEALQRAFVDRRRRTVRLRALASALTLFVLLTIGLAVISLLAIHSAARAEREALTAQLQVSAADAERLATTPDTGLALRRILSDVSAARAGLDQIPTRTRVALWRVLHKVRDNRVWTVDTAQIYSVGWDPANGRIITLERDGGVSGYDLNGARMIIVAPTGEDNATISFSGSGTAIQRAEGKALVIYSLSGERLSVHRPGEGDAEDYLLRDVDPVAGSLLWSGDDGCLRMTPLEGAPRGREPVHCMGEDGFDFARFSAGSAEIFYATVDGTVRRVSRESGDVLAENTSPRPFNNWYLRADGQDLIAMRGDRMIRMNADLEIIASLSLNYLNDGDGADTWVHGAVLWDEGRVLTIRSQEERPMQLYTLALEPVGRPFRHHTKTAAAAVPEQSAFVSVGYIDRIMRVFSARTSINELIGKHTHLEFARIAYCKTSKTLLLGDFRGSLHYLDPADSSAMESISLGEQMIDALDCLDNGRWVALTNGQLFTGTSFFTAPATIISFRNQYVRKMSKYGSGIAVASYDKIYLLDELALNSTRSLSNKDSLEFEFKDHGSDMIFALAAPTQGGQLAVGIKSGYADARLGLLDIKSGKLEHSSILNMRDMMAPWTIVYAPDGSHITVAGLLLRVDRHRQDGEAVWSVRGGDAPFIASIAYVDDDLFVGAGFWKRVSLWSTDGTVLEADFDADLRSGAVSLAPGAPGEIFAADSEGTIKRILFDTSKLEVLAARILSQRGEE